jgi:hypothetical protein
VLQSDGTVNNWLPQIGVVDSKWQLTLLHCPRIGVAVWGNAEVELAKTDVWFLYLAVKGELLILEDTLILPSR